MVEYYRVQGSLACVSMVGSLLIILSFFFMKELRRHPINLVFYLSVCDFIFSAKFALTAVLPDSEAQQNDETFCLLTALVGQFFGLASIGWNGMINLNLMINLRKPFVDTSKFVKFYHLWVWALSLITTGLMFGLDEWGPSGDGTCWIEGSYNLFKLTFFLPLVSYFALGIITFLLALWATRYMRSSESNRERTQIIFRMSFYVIIFVLCWSGPLAHRLAQYFNWAEHGPAEKFLRYWDAVGSSVQGFMNAIVWLSSPTIFKGFKKTVLMRLDYWNLVIKGEDASIPLLGDRVNELLEGSDVQKFDSLLRKNIITFMLYGMKESVETVKEKLKLDLRAVDFKTRCEVAQTSDEAKHMTEFRFLDFCPLVFQRLRALDGIPPSDYLASIQPKTFLENLENQKFSEGRSGSFFCFSPDKCFIIKTIPENEAHLLRQILPSYYGYIMNNPGTLLMRFYGLHAIQMQFSDQVFVCVMGNGFNTHNKIHEKYDLKGSWINRCVGKAHERDTSVLGMDMDLERMGRKVVVSPETRKKLVKQLKKDAEFLKSLDIMDYSILLGYHWRDKEGGPNQKLELKAQLKAKQTKRSGLRKIGSDMFSPSNSRSSSRRSSENNTSASTPIAVVRDKEKEKEKVVYSVGESETPVLGSSASGLSPLPEDLETGDGDAGHIFSESDSELASFSEGFVGSRADPGIPTYDNSTEFYYLTVIDTLQLYDLNKKSERFWKVYVVQKDKRGISVQPPEAYCKRFVRAAKRLIITPAKCAAIVGQGEKQENV